LPTEAPKERRLAFRYANSCYFGWQAIKIIIESNAMWHYVYILQNKSGKQYVGQTSDVNMRLKEHNEGSVIATKNLRPWKIEWFCGFRNKAAAIKFEKYLKSGSGTSIRYRHIAPHKLH